jgi:hypothetical protein
MCQARRFERGPEIRIGLFPFWGVEGRRLAGRPGTWILPAISFVFFILDANNNQFDDGHSFKFAARPHPKVSRRQSYQNDPGCSRWTVRVGTSARIDSDLDKSGYKIAKRTAASAYGQLSSCGLRDLSKQDMLG